MMQPWLECTNNEAHMRENASTLHLCLLVNALAGIAAALNRSP
jgi:hypothetical protein